MMNKIRVSSPDLDEGFLYELDLSINSYKVVSGLKDDLPPGRGIEIYLVGEDRKALVAMYSDGKNIQLFLVDFVFNLSEGDIEVKMSKSLKGNSFSVMKFGETLKSIRYRYPDIQDDLLEDLFYQLNDPLKDVSLKNMVEFFNESNPKKRLKMEIDNVEVNKRIRLEYSKSLPFFKRVLFFIKNY